MKKENVKRSMKFTLVELLVVIGIIALLAALLFPAISSVRGHAKKVKAQAVITALKTAITQYESQYGILPLPAGVTYGTDIKEGNRFTDDQYDALIELLSCVNVNGGGEGYNARKTRFLTGLPVTGTNNAERTLTDPYTISGQKYGTRLAVLMDLDGTNQVQVNGSPEYNGKLFIYSYGPNGTDDKGVSKSSGDDVPSWE